MVKPVQSLSSEVVVPWRESLSTFPSRVGWIFMIKVHGAILASLLTILADRAFAQEPGVIEFARDVQPLLKAHCIDCHGPTVQKNGFRLDRRRDAMKGGTISVIGPGNSTASRLYLRLIGQDSVGPRMPPDGPLRPEEINVIKAWIDQGATCELLFAAVDVGHPPAGLFVDRRVGPLTACRRDRVRRIANQYGAVYSVAIRMTKTKLHAHQIVRIAAQADDVRDAGLRFAKGLERTLYFAFLLKETWPGCDEPGAFATRARHRRQKKQAATGTIRIDPNVSLSGLQRCRPFKTERQQVNREHVHGHADAAFFPDDGLATVVADRPACQDFAFDSVASGSSAYSSDASPVLEQTDNLHAAPHLARGLAQYQSTRLFCIARPRLNICRRHTRKLRALVVEFESP